MHQIIPILSIDAPSPINYLFFLGIYSGPRWPVFAPLLECAVRAAWVASSSSCRGSLLSVPDSNFFPGTLSVFCAFFLRISASSSAISASILAPFEGSLPWRVAWMASDLFMKGTMLRWTYQVTGFMLGALFDFPLVLLSIS